LKAHPETPQNLVRLLFVLQRKGSISNADVRRICHVARNIAARMLTEFVQGKWLISSGKRGVGARYMPAERLLHQSPIAPQTAEAGAMNPEAKN
jgi:hypothetical protein